MDRLLSVLPDGWHASSYGRREATREDPQLFALTYLRPHCKGPETGDSITWAECHDDWYGDMAEWVNVDFEPRAWRHLYVAPRASAKSTVWFLAAPMWALAHGHASFVAAFADAGSQAEAHLATFRKELRTNALLRADFPELCTPAGTTDNRVMYQSSGGSVFVARGIDAASLGLKIGMRRPDVLILDDVEPGSGVYSAYQAEQRHKTISDTILPLSEFARVVWIGTVTMPGSLVHQALRGAPWVTEDKWTVTHHKALYSDDDGNPVSLWPDKWPVDYLLSIKDQRGFHLNFQNEPRPDDGDYWRPADITYADPVDDPQWIISVDPAVSDRHTSDDSGIAVLSSDGHRVLVRDTRGVKATGRELRGTIESLLARWPQVRVLVVETNQGGNLWRQVFDGLPVRYRPTWSSAPKSVRAGWLLDFYQQRRVMHSTGWDDSRTVEQLLSFPRAPHDDIIDAIGAGVRYFLGDPVENKGQLLARSR